jgi:SlyX protein
MSEKEAVQELARQLVDIQSQLAFQEEHISQLNEALAQQQRDIEGLQAESRVLRQQYREIQQQQTAPDAEPPPPHY